MPCAGCLAFRHGRTSKPSDFTHFNGRQGPAFTELTLLRPLRMRARWMPVSMYDDVEARAPVDMSALSACDCQCYRMSAIGLLALL